MAAYRSAQGHQLVDGRTCLPRHVHRTAYATILLAGRYVEAGDGGRHHVAAGDVLVHTPFEAHANRFAAQRGVLFNVALDDRTSLALAGGQVADPEGLVRDLIDDPGSASALLASRVVAIARPDAEIVDRLASDLRGDGCAPLSIWAREQGMPSRTLRRHFVALYGVTPAHFRARARALRAWRRIVLEHTPLAAIACDCGFADQAHLSRAIAAVTGAPPRRWRLAD